MKNKNGITLISLVVTIIVLIILAGITINLLLGQDGIIKKAEQAKKDTEQAQANELAWLKDIGYYIDGYGPILKEVPEGYIPIYTKEDLAKVATGDGTDATKYEIKGVKYDMLPTSNYILMSNIDLKDYTGSDGNGWDPIINFAGIFDGNGCAIDNLTINRPDATEPQALFRIENPVEKIEIKNVTLTNIDIRSCMTIAGILFDYGSSDKDISNCKVYGKLESTATLYGITNTASNIMDCYVYANMKSTDGAIYGIGQASNIEDCHIRCDTIDGKYAVYGIGIAPTIKKCNIEAQSMTAEAGVMYGIGVADTIIEDCYVHSTIMEAGNPVYGIGKASTIKKCNVEANSMISKYVFVQGIGEATILIEDCYVHSDSIKVNNGEYICGIGISPSIKRCSLKSYDLYAKNVYGIAKADSNITIENCYTIMSADAINIMTIGGNNVINCYSVINAKPEEMIHKFYRCIITREYSIIKDDSFGVDKIVKYDNMENTYLNGLNKYSDGYRKDYTTETFYRTYDQLRDKATFEGWDENIWKFESNINSGFPYLAGGERVVDKVEI